MAGWNLSPTLTSSPQVDMLVGDIYGGRDYTGIGLSANTIASSFGKVLYENKVGAGWCTLGGWVCGGTRAWE